MKNPKKFSKTPNPRFQNMKCMNEKGLEAYQVKKNLVKSLRTKIGVRFKCFRKRNRVVSRERSMEMRTGLRRGLIYDRCRCREVSSDLSRRCQGNTRRQLRCRGGIEDQHIKFKNKNSIDPLGIEKLLSIQIQSR